MRLHAGNGLIDHVLFLLYIGSKIGPHGLGASLVGSVDGLVVWGQEVLVDIVLDDPVDLSILVLTGEPQVQSMLPEDHYN